MMNWPSSFIQGLKFLVNKLVTNSALLNHSVEQENEGEVHGNSNIVEEDKSYTKDVLVSKQYLECEHKILGVK